MLREHVSWFGMQWHTHLSSVVWVYHNMLHPSTGKKPLFLLFWFKCCHHIKAATLPTKSLNTTEVTDYWEEIMLNLSSALALAAIYINLRSTAEPNRSVWLTYVLTLANLEWEIDLSRPWQVPYGIISHNDPDVIAVKVFSHPILQYRYVYINQELISVSHLLHMTSIGMVERDQSLED